MQQQQNKKKHAHDEVTTEGVPQSRSDFSLPSDFWGRDISPEGKRDPKER